MLRLLILLAGVCIPIPAHHSAATLKADDEPAIQNANRDSVRDYNPRQVLRKPIRPIVDPDVIAVDKADVRDNELVLGVEVNGQARAYPINQLTGPQREIINDELGGRAIAATW